jgi:DNA-binding response OmpR family regulator
MNMPESSEGSGAVLRGRVLIVSRDSIFLGYYRDIVVEIGMRPFMANAYESGMARLRAEAFDFVVVDQGSLMFEGRCILECLREAGERTPILVTTRRFDTYCYRAAMRLGAVKYLEDPVAAPELVRVISTSLGRTPAPAESATSREPGLSGRDESKVRI